MTARRVACATLACAALAGAQEPAPAAPPRFRDVAAAVGLTGLPSYRCALLDVDGDGWDDAVIQEKDLGHDINPGGALRILRNVADATAPGGRRFADVPGAVPPLADGTVAEGATPKGVFAVFGDVDNDGVMDAFRACYQEPAEHPKSPDTGERSAILRGTGTSGAPAFAVVPASGVAADGPVTTCAAAFLDFDRDGHLDLFVGNWYVQYGTDLRAHVDRLYRGDGTGRFTDVTGKAGLLTLPTVGAADSSRPTYGVSHTDIDGDGWPDLLVATYGRQWNRLWHNRGDGTFEDWGPRTGFDGDADRSGKYPAWIQEHPRLKGREDEAPYRSNGNTFSAVPADCDDDGDMDVMLLEITHGWAGPSADLTALLVNGGAGATPPCAFTRVTAPFSRIPPDQRMWNQGDYVGAWGDLDNDGRLDFVLGSGAYPDNQRLRVFRQSGPGAFTDASAEWGIDFRDAGGVGCADVDVDGALDLLATGMPKEWNGRPGPVTALFRNTPTPGQHWLTITLDGAAGTPDAEGKPRAGANRAAIGAWAWATAGGVTRTREVHSSTGHFGLAPSRTLHFGLGASARVERLRVRWPDAAGSVQEATDLAVDRHYVWRQGAAAPKPR